QVVREEQSRISRDIVENSELRKSQFFKNPVPKGKASCAGKLKKYFGKPINCPWNYDSGYVLKEKNNFQLLSPCDFKCGLIATVTVPRADMSGVIQTNFDFEKRIAISKVLLTFFSPFYWVNFKRYLYKRFLWLQFKSAALKPFGVFIQSFKCLHYSATSGHDMKFLRRFLEGSAKSYSEREKEAQD
ncbi:hypothetical protein ROZALSC1DRAFT_24513, partial [Rozella allomycis CSF55]